MSAELTSCDVEVFVAEHVSSEDVHDAHDGHNNARGDSETPEGAAERFLGGGCFVEVAEDADAQNYHNDTESNEPGGWREERPVVGGVATEDTDFREYEGHCNYFGLVDYSKRGEEDRAYRLGGR